MEREEEERGRRRSGSGRNGRRAAAAATQPSSPPPVPPGRPAYMWGGFVSCWLQGRRHAAPWVGRGCPMPRDYSLVTNGRLGAPRGARSAGLEPWGEGKDRQAREGKEREGNEGEGKDLRRKEQEIQAGEGKKRKGKKKGRVRETGAWSVTGKEVGKLMGRSRPLVNDSTYGSRGVVWPPIHSPPLTLQNASIFTRTRNWFEKLRYLCFSSSSSSQQVLLISYVLFHAVTVVVISVFFGDCY